MYSKAIGYLVTSGAVGILLLYVATPNTEEIQRIKDFGGKTATFTDVLKAASDPSSKPMYLQKSGQQNPLKSSESGDKK